MRTGYGMESYVLPRPARIRKNMLPVKETLSNAEVADGFALAA
jgi:hypothetical protein